MILGGGGVDIRETGLLHLKVKSSWFHGLIALLSALHPRTHKNNPGFTLYMYPAQREGEGERERVRERKDRTEIRKQETEQEERKKEESIFLAASKKWQMETAALWRGLYSTLSPEP